MEKSYLIGNIKMSDSKQLYLDTLSKIQSDGLYKKERTITTSQNININTEEGGEVLNFCANNYLGLANNSEIINEAKKALDQNGFGMASVGLFVELRIFTKN